MRADRLNVPSVPIDDAEVDADWDEVTLWDLPRLLEDEA